MERLLTDWSVRRGAQVLLLSIVVAMLLLEAAFLVMVILHYADRIEDYGLQSLVPVLFSALSFPFEAEYGALATTAAATFPLVVSAICYQVDPNEHPPVATSNLNRTGHICLLVLAGGVLVGLVNVFVSVQAASDIVMMAGNDAKRVAIRGLFSVLLSFQLFYLIHLLGVRK